MKTGFRSFLLLSVLILSPSLLIFADEPAAPKLHAGGQTKQYLDLRRSGDTSKKMSGSILFKAIEPGVTWPFFVTNGKEYKIQTCDETCKAEIDKCKGGEKCEIKAEVSEGDEPFILARTLKVLPKKLSDPEFDKNFNFSEVEPGEFNMGSPPGEQGRFDNETLHRVTISKGFEIGKTEVTQGMWKKVKGSLPKGISKQDDNLPITNVSWKEVQDFMGRLNKVRQGDEYTYRLPTEAEWEYAARGAQKASSISELQNAYSFGNSSVGLDDHAWSWNNSKDGVKPVATRKANQLDLSDMHGNVWEWVQDAYGDYGELSSSKDPVNESGSCRVIRGGGWSYNPRYLRSANRYLYGPDGSDGHVGFRLVRTPNP